MSPLSPFNTTAATASLQAGLEKSQVLIAALENFGILESLGGVLDLASVVRSRSLPSY